MARFAMRPVLLSLAALALALCLTVTTVAGAEEQCHSFQSLNEPTQSPWLTRCGAARYKSSACCDTAAAKRAYNWVWEDDGCGVVNYVCALALSDLACATNCSPDLVVTDVNYNNSKAVLPGKVVISASYAKKLYSACETASWMTSTCTYMGVSRGSDGKLSLESRTAKDTCQPVMELNPVSFAENILGFIVHQDDSVGYVSDVHQVPYYPNSAFGMSRPAAGLLALLATLVLSVMRRAL